MIGSRRRPTRRIQRRIANPSGLTPMRRTPVPRTGIKPFSPYQGGSRVTTGLPNQQGGGGGYAGMLGLKKTWDDSVTRGGETRENIESGWQKAKDMAGDAGDWLSETWSDSPLGEATNMLSQPTDNPPPMPVLGQPDAGSGLQGASAPPDMTGMDSTLLVNDPSIGASGPFAGGNTSGMETGSEGMGSLDGSGLEGSGSIGKAMPYLNIAKDVITGAEPEITGSQAGDAALRVAAAYATAGLSELGYSVYRMFS